MSSAAQAYAQAALATGNPHDIKAQLLLKAAGKLQVLVNRGETAGEQVTRTDAAGPLEYNEKVWSLFLHEALNDDSPYPPALRKNMEKLGLFVISHTLALRASRLEP